MAYGDKRDFPKIDIWVRGKGYQASTTWARTCAEAALRYATRHGLNPDLVGANFARKP